MKPLIHALLVVLALGLTSCGTISPDSVIATTPAIDGNSPTAGMTGFLPDGNQGVTPFFVENFNRRVKTYGKLVFPNAKALPKDTKEINEETYKQDAAMTRLENTTKGKH